MGLSRIFDIARSSLAAYQSALDVTSHNIANASNENYSRQRVDLSARTPQKLATFIWGTGVEVSQVSRARNQLIDTQIRNNNSRYYDSKSRSETLNQVESLFTEPSDLGISSLIDSFFNSWNELSVTPNSPTLRADVVRSAQKLSSQVQTVYEGLDEIKTNLVNDAGAKVKDLNRLLKQVQSINGQIVSASVNGGQNNDLLDQRDQIIDQISQIVNISVSFDSSNSALVSIGGVFAADQNMSVEFKIDSINGKMALVTANGNSTANIKSGELFSDIDTYSTNIQDYQSKLNEVMNTLVDSVNSVHSTGYSLKTPAETGINFFQGYKDGVLTINDRILSDVNNIAVSGDGTLGNGDIAVKIADLSSQNLLNGTTFTENYSTLVSGVGSDTLSASQLTDAGQMVLQQLQDQKYSYSGVSIDEEMSNVIKYQRSYEASAKLITIADDLLQTLLGIVQ